jgi:flagellar hook-basal body complex protein FliE
MEINPLGPSVPQQATGTGPAQPSGQPSVNFKELLADALGQVNNLQQAADTSIAQFASGKPVAIDEVMLAVQKAELALQMTQQIRNKLVEAYQEVTRMQI